MDGFTSVGNGTITGDLLIQEGSGFPRITLQDSDGTNTRSFINHSASDLTLTSQNDTANGRILFSRYDGTTTATSGYFDATGKFFASGDLDVAGNTTAVNTTLTGYLRGPASFTIDPATHADDTGTVIIAGNLQVDGTQTTINSTTLTVDDLNLTLASGATDSAAANGAGITIDGATASLTYAHSGTKFVFNKPLDVTSSGVSTVKISGNYPRLFFEDTAGTDLDAYIVNNANGLFFGKTNSPTGTNDVLSLDLSTKNATFAGTIKGTQVDIGNGSAGGTSEILFSDNVSARGKIKYNHGSSPEVMTLETTGTVALTIDNAQNATFAGNLSANGITANGGAVYSETAQGAAKGTIHLDPDSVTDHAGTALTFGASDSGSGNTAQAGIYTRSDGSYGTKMYLSTTDNYSAGSKTAIKIDHLGRVDILRGNLTVAGTIGANDGTVSLPSLSFANDPNTGIYRSASDNLGFAIGGTARAFMSNSQFNIDTKVVATELDINGVGDVSGNLTAGALYSSAGLRNAGGSDFGSQQSFWASSGGSTHQAGYTIGWNTGLNNSRTQKMRLNDSGNLLINQSVSVGGVVSSLKGYFYEDTFDQNGNAKPTSVVGVAAATNSVGEGPTIDFSSIWSQNSVYQQDAWNEGWTIGRIGAVYDNQVSNGGALVFYTHSGTTASGGANNAQVSEKMRIRPNGNVGIGVALPSVKLQVAGEILATNVSFTDGSGSSCGFSLSGSMADMNCGTKGFQIRGDGGFVNKNMSNNPRIAAYDTSVSLYVSAQAKLVLSATDAKFTNHVYPVSDDAIDLGSATLRWRNVYTGDLHLSNEGKEEGNEVDGTTGNWTIQEGEEHLYIINNKSGKKFKFSLEEIE